MGRTRRGKERTNVEPGIRPSKSSLDPFQELEKSVEEKRDRTEEISRSERRGGGRGRREGERTTESLVPRGRMELMGPKAKGEL